ncbi:SDR family oxidoreductase [bacterium]|nr:SDR family oxidoreductase [bacterium]
MEIEEKVIVVTGGSGGIGQALATSFIHEKAKIVIVLDINFDNFKLESNKLISKVCDVTNERELTRIIDEINHDFGLIDIFCSNAGILSLGNEQTTREDWNKNWYLHVMSHVFAAKKLIPEMLKRGSGYFVNTSSAAGLLSHIDSVTYSTTKHAAIGFAEWIAITYGKQGIGVSILCPQAVETAMTKGREKEVSALDGMMRPEQVALDVIKAIKEETFLISPHEQVLGYFQNKANNYSRWIGGMQKLRQKLKS